MQEEREKKVEEDKEKAKSGKKRRRRSFVKHPFLLSSPSGSISTTCLLCRHRCWIPRLLPGSASSFSSGSSSWNWEGEGDHHLPACHGPSARHREKGRKFQKRCIRRAEERQHPGLQESREEKKKKRVRGQPQHTEWTCCCSFPFYFNFSTPFSSGGNLLKIFLTLFILSLTGADFYFCFSLILSSHNRQCLSSPVRVPVSSLCALSTITIFIKPVSN